MSGWLLDTNVLTELRPERRFNAVCEWVYAKPRESVYISIVCLAELEKGIYLLSPQDPDRLRISNLRRSFENYFRSYVLPVSDNVVMRWGQLMGDAQRLHGVRLDPVDALLAATALEHDLVLVTRNTRDMVHTGATIFDPFTS